MNLCEGFFRIEADTQAPGAAITSLLLAPYWMARVVWLPTLNSKIIRSACRLLVTMDGGTLAWPLEILYKIHSED